VTSLEDFESLDGLINFSGKHITVKLIHCTTHPVLNSIVVVRCQSPHSVEGIKFISDDFDSTKVGLGQTIQTFSFVTDFSLSDGLVDFFVKLLRLPTCFLVVFEFLIILDLLKRLLNFLDINSELILHPSQFNLEVSCEIVQQLNAVVLGLVDFDRACKGPIHVFNFAVLQLEQILFKHVQLGLDTCDNAVDCDLLVGQLLDECSCFGHFLDVIVLFASNLLHNLVNFFFDLSLALLNFLFDET